MKLASFLKYSEVQLFVVFKAELCREGRSQSLGPVPGGAGCIEV